MEIAGVQWDHGNWPKCAKHGVTKSEIEHVLRHGRVAPDVGHSLIEDRFIAVGANELGRLLFVGFTYRRMGDGIWLRPITARYMHAKEVQRYGSQSAADED